MSDKHRIRVVTYNIHKCRGLDRRVRPARIVEVLRELDADIIALQEVVSVTGAGPEADQARYIAEGLGCQFTLGENRRHNGGAYGNVLLSRLRFREARNYDISVARRERRGCLRADLELSGEQLLHVFNVHLGTAFLERRHQARQLLTERILGSEGLTGARLVVGDFNEWTRGLATRMLGAHLESADPRVHLRRSRTYPGVLPFFHLDHIYFDPLLDLQSMRLHRSRQALIASDHLPLVADFHLRQTEAQRFPLAPAAAAS
jgi:endonuclease/exonuclease/phosphatase family metal-dependent hydrolase